MEKKENSEFISSEERSLYEVNTSGDIQEQFRKKDIGLVCFGELRARYPEYDNATLAKIVKDPRITGFKDARRILNKSGVDVMGIEKKKEDLGFLANNLTHGLIEPISSIVTTGVCFPERPTVQSILPLLAVKNLLDNNKIDTAYVALPLFAYAGAGLARRSQYLQTIGIMEHLYGDQLGEKVFIISDARSEIMTTKYKLCNLHARSVSDDPAREKYPFNNLFGFFETATYGADIVITSLTEQKPVTIVSDFRQFESIHAGIKMAKPMHYDVGALLYTLTAPVMVNGKLREVSQDEDILQDERQSSVPEINNLFYQSAVLLPEDQTRDLYDRVRKGYPLDDFRKRIQDMKRRLLGIDLINEKVAEELENISIARMKQGVELLDSTIANTVDNLRSVKGGTIYERR